MTKFSLKDYTLTLLRLYRKEGEEVQRLLEDLEYYMLETIDVDKYLYFIVANKFDIYIIWKDDITKWTHEKISLIVSNSLKKSTFMHIYLNGYNGVMNPDFWADIKRSMEYYKDVKKFRKELDKIEMLEEIITPKKIEITIDEILNKINDSGIDSLTDEEKQTLKNHNNE